MNKPHKHKDLIIAWANGAEIEYLDDNGKWNKQVYPCWYESGHYRIKLQPKLVPFDKEEALDKLIGVPIASKDTGARCLITGVSKYDGSVRINGHWIKPKYLLEEYTFLDGSPCGKYVEE